MPTSPKPVTPQAGTALDAADAQALLEDTGDLNTSNGVALLSAGLDGYGLGREGDPSFTAWYKSLQTAVTSGRGGLGEAVIMPAGDDGSSGTDTLALQPFASNYRLITVGGVNTDGTPDSGVTEGPGMLVAAADGQGGSATAAAAVALDVIAMLASNSKLGWLDIQDILADSATQPAAAATDFTPNGARDWNGGGMLFGNAEGFGVVDPNVATWLAQAWNVTTAASHMASTTISTTTTLSLPVGTTVNEHVTLGADTNVQKVVVNFAASNLALDDATVVLTSPDGTRSTLFSDDGDGTVTLGDAQVTDNAFMGEDAKGTWTVGILNAATGAPVPTVGGVSLTIVGDSAAVIDPMVFTPTFAGLAASARETVTDNGSHTIDLIALTAPTSINLAGGASTIDGVTVKLGTGFTSARANGSTGSVVLTAAAANNDLLWGGIGSTTLTGGAGHDTLIAGGGNTSIATNAGGYDTIDFTQADTTAGTPTGSVTTHGGDTILAGVANLTVNAVQGSASITGGAGTLNVMAGGGSAIVRAGSGSTTIAGGAGATTVTGGSGPIDLVGGTGTVKAALSTCNVTLVGGTGSVDLPQPSAPQITRGTGIIVLAQGTGMPTVTGGVGHTSVIGSTGSMLALGGANSLTVIQAGGPVTAEGGTGSLSVKGSTGALLVVANSGALSVTGGSGVATILAASGTMNFSGGAGTASVTLADGASTITPGSGGMTIAGGSGAFVLRAGGGTVSLLGGTGSMNATGGNHGYNQMTAGTGTATLTGGGGGDILTAAGSASQTLQAGIGAETLAGAAASGADLFVAGLGNDVITLGTGADTVTFVSGQTGTSVYSVQGFGVGDFLHLQGFGTTTTPASVVASQSSDGHGGTMVTLFGGARIDLAGVGQVTSQMFR